MIGAIRGEPFPAATVEIDRVEHLQHAHGLLGIVPVDLGGDQTMASVQALLEDPLVGIGQVQVMEGFHRVVPGREAAEAGDRGDLAGILVADGDDSVLGDPHLEQGLESLAGLGGIPEQGCDHLGHESLTYGYSLNEEALRPVPAIGH